MFSSPVEFLIIFGFTGVWFCLRLSGFLGSYVNQLRRDPSEWGRFVLLMRMAEEAREQQRLEVTRYIRSWKIRLGLAVAAVLLLALSLYIAGGC